MTEPAGAPASSRPVRRLPGGDGRQDAGGPAGRMPALQWTGGQYSLYRAVFGVYLLIHFAMLLPWGRELFSEVLPAAASPLLRAVPNVLAIWDAPVALIAIALIATVFFAIGLFDRIAAVVLWYVLACLFGRNPLIANPSLPYVGWLLLAHAFLPPAPYGSWAARKRTDPRGGWFFPRPIWIAAWIAMALGYTYSGYTKLVSASWVDGTALSRMMTNPLARPTFIRELMVSIPSELLVLATWATLALELLYAPLALSRRVRPWIWLAMLLLHLGLLVLIDFADLTFGMVVLHLFTFDPAWVRPFAPARRDVIRYDGKCGLCHGVVRFVVAEDTAGAFAFSPLESGEATDSVVVEIEDGTRLQRSDAVRYILARLGGLWRVLSIAGAVVPRPLRDIAYEAVARNRYRLFRRASEACPMLPPDLRSRFRPV